MNEIKHENKRPLKEKVSITLDSEIVERIAKLAEDDERNFSQYINRVLKNHIREQTELHKTKSDLKGEGL